MSMAVFLLIAAVVMILCVILNKVSSRFGIPTLLAFIFLGMLFGSDGLIKIQFDNYGIAEKVCTFSLIFIMFYGGFGTNWKTAKPVAKKSILLSSLGVILTSGIMGLLCHYVLRMGWAESFLLGSVVGSTDAASVFSILRSKRLNLKYHSAPLLEVESGSNDPFSYMLTAIMISIVNGTAKGGEIAYMIFAQLVFGVGIGALISLLAVNFLKRFKFANAGFDAVFVFAIATIAYALPTVVGGNGFLSTYIVGIVLGNQPMKYKKSLVNFFDGVTTVMQMLVFFLLGLLAFPSQLPAVAGVALLAALILTFIARPVATALIMLPFKCKLNQIAFVSWSGLRGAASIVFAVMAIMGAPNMQIDLYHIVFFIVLFSILIQGSLLPLAAKKLNMIDDKADVLKTFTDYSDEVSIQFIQLQIVENHPWIDKKIKNLVIPPDTLIVMIKRGEENVVPNGNTEISLGDIIVMGARAHISKDDLFLTEKTIAKDDPWIGKMISEVSTEPDKLIIMIQRNGNIVIPYGKTVIKENDLLVMNQV